MLAKLPDPAPRIAGYIVEGPPEAPHLIVFDQAEVPRAIYRARFADGKLVEDKVLADADDRTIAPETRRMIAALAAARKAIAASKDARPCGPSPFNTVVLPPASPGAPIAVYFLTAQSGVDQVPFGGHFEIDVATDGIPGPIRRFTRACLTPDKPIADKKVASIVVSQLIGDLPTEIHVFSSLALDRPVGVITEHPRPRVRTVVAGRIGTPADLNH